MVLAPTIKFSFLTLLFVVSVFAKNSRGAVPVPPPINNMFPWFWVKLFPKGPRMPIVAPVFMACRCCVASPTAFTATLTSPSLVTFSMLNGISSIPGIQSIKNWPGLALAHCLSVNVYVLTDGLSVITCVIVVVRKVLALVR